MARPVALPPVPLPAAPVMPLPPGACDAHVHLVGDDFALWNGRVEDPAAGSLDDYLALYRAHLDRLGCARGVIVHSILYGTDMSVTAEACARMGEGFVGLGLVTDAATPAELDALVAANIRGVRLNYVHGGVLSWDGMKRLAPMLADRGLHVEMLAHSHEHLVELAPQVPELPVEIVFDHCAWPDLSLGLNTPGHVALLRLLGEGRAWVKLSAPYRYGGTAELLQSLVSANPAQCLWGSDWPHVMLNGAPHPDAGEVLNQTLTAIDPGHHRAIFTDNPARLYRF